MRCRLNLPRLGWLIASLGWCTNLSAQTTPSVPVSDIGDQALAIGSATKKDAKKSQLLVVPIPLSNPALGSGLTLAGVLFYNPNKAPQPWITGIGATYTSNHSKAVGAVHSMSLKGDRFRIVALVGYADVNVKFYGIGPSAGDRDRFVKIEDKGLATLLQGQMRIVNHLYVGARYEFLDLKSSIKVANPIFPDLKPPTPELESNLSAIGPMMTYDSRDNSLNPRRGIFAVVTWLLNSPDIGSDYGHDKFQLQANGYHPLGRNTVIAGRVAMCGVSTGAPFYDLCMYGQMGDLRGYESGRYRDRATWAVQAELRQHLFWRLGAVAFVGGGGTAPSLSHLDDSKFLPAAGAGLRILASKRNNVNLRLDYAVGKHSHALYFGIGEAF